MAVIIRLMRTGTNKVSRFRLVAAEEKYARDGRFLENLGNYNPQAEPKVFTIKTERVAYWISQGAQVSETVNNLLKQDRFFEKAAGLKKGLTLESMNLERKPEPKRRAKKKKVTKAA